MYIVQKRTTKHYYKSQDDQTFHRDDGPAIEDDDIGLYAWYNNGVLHRDNNLPAYIHPAGTILYFKHGKLHRTDGPAELLIVKNQVLSAVYHIEGKQVSLMEFALITGNAN